MFLISRFGLVGSVLNSWRFGVRFFEVVTSQSKCRVCQKSQERQVPKSGQIVAKMWAFISPCAFSTAVLQMQTLKAWQSPTFLHTNGEAAVAPPWGSSIRRPPKVCRACWITTTSLSTKAPDLSQMAKLLMASSSSCSENSYTPLFFSPQEPGDHRRPCAKKRKNGTLWLFFSIFCPSKLRSKFCIEKTSKKV